MTHPLLIIVTGLPCTGKTVLGSQIASQFHLPMLAKDEIKVILFDCLGWSDRPWSKKLSKASNQLLIQIAKSLLSAGQSIIIESNFPALEVSQQIIALTLGIPCRILQVLCVAEGEILVERFIQRWESGERHPGHVDDQSLAEIRSTLLPGRLAPLDLEGPVIEIDTTDFSKIDYASLFALIRLYLQESRNEF